MRASSAPLRAAAVLLPSLLVVSLLTAGGAVSRPHPGAPPPLAVPAAASMSTAPGGFTTVTATRILDTRSVSGGRLPLPRLGVRRIVVAGKAGVPASGASAVVLRVTAFGPQRSGYFTVYPGGTPRPNASTLNFPPTTSVGAVNMATVRLPSDGSISIFNGSPGSTHALVDVLGYYVPPHAARSAGEFTANAPSRLLDTRLPGGRGQPLAAGRSYAIGVLGRAGVPAHGVSAVALNVTVVNPGHAGTLGVSDSGAAQPATSTVSFGAGQTIASAAVARVSGGGRIYVASTAGPYHLVIDVVGWYADGSASGVRSYPAGTVPTGIFTPVTASRVLDRTAAAGQAAMPPGFVSRVLVPGSAAVPRSGVAALLIAVTVPRAQADGLIKVFPADGSIPLDTPVVFNNRAPKTALTVAPVAADGMISVANSSSGSTELQIDVLGWFANRPLAAVGAPTGSWPTPGTTGSDVALARQVLLNANRYALQTWWPGEAQSLMQMPLDASTPSLDAKTDPNGDPVRRLGMEAFSLAISRATGAINASNVGSIDTVGTLAHVDSVIRAIVNRVAATHIANTPNGWGGGWQGSLWAAMVGRAAWLDWAAISPGNRLNVERMVEYEADTVLATGVRYLRNGNGSFLTQGNTGAEEDSWYALATELALVMMPTHPHAAAWQHKTAQLLVAAWAAPQDDSDPDISSRVVNGARLSQWLNGSNVEADGSVVNHCRIAPDYSTNAYQNVDAALLFSLARRPTPEVAFQGLDRVYAGLSSIDYPDGGTDPDPASRCGTRPALTFASPGGTVYASGSPSIYYPEGGDWGTGQQIPFALFDAQAAAFGFDRYAPPDHLAHDMEMQHLNAQAAMQARFSDGHTYADDTEYNYVGREEHAAQLAGQLWLTTFVRDRRMLQITTASFYNSTLAREYSRLRVQTTAPMFESRLQTAP